MTRSARIDAALARARRSERLLASARIPRNRHLPVLRAPARGPSATAVRRRTLVLSAVQAVAFGRAPASAVDWLRGQRLWSAVSADERALLTARRRRPADRDRMAWRAEALWTLWWALGLVERLSWPARQSDLGEVLDRTPAPVPWIGDDVARFVARGPGLRDREALLDAADLTYRAHWAIRDAALHGRRPPAALDPDVIAERHHALNWVLARHAGADWDDVDTPT